MSDITTKLQMKLEEKLEEITALRKELSAYKEGIRPEDADKCKTYISYDDEDGPSEVVWVHTKGYWMYSSDFDEIWVNSMATRLYPLPQKEKS